MPTLRFLLWKGDFPPHKSSRPTRTHCWICLKIRKGSTLSRSSKVFRQSEPHNASIQCGNAPCSLTVSSRRLRPNPALHPLVRDRRRSGFHTCFAYFHLIFGASRKAAESNARQKDVKSIEAMTALPNAHFFLLCPFTHGESMQSVAAMDLHPPKIP